MKKKMIIVGLVLLLAGCVAQNQFFDPVGRPEPVGAKMDCPGSSGPDIQVIFGDSKIFVTPHVRVPQEGRLVIRVVPQGSPDKGPDFGERTITLTNKDDPTSWPNTSFKASDKNPESIVVCVKQQPEGSYRYLVDIDGVGQIDPRIDVIPLQ